MQASTGPPTAVGAVQEARLALRSALYDAALELLDGCEDWAAPFAEEAVVLKAETLGRRDPVAALSYLTGVDDVFVSPAGRFGRDIEAARAYAATRDFEAASRRHAAAAALADVVPNGAATVAYHAVRLRWLRRDCDPDAPEIAVALTHPDPSIVAATYAFRGWLHAGRGDYRAQIADFRTALACVPEPGMPIDVASRSATTFALARVAFEVADAEGVRVAYESMESIPWTPDIEVDRFSTLRAIGWDAFMRGESGRAQLTFKEARNHAPSPAWRAMAHLDRAYVARIARNEIWALEELGEADRIARDVRWESTRGEERQVLPILAALHAPVDPARAQRYASLYSQIGTANVNPLMAIAGDRRTVASARYAQGLIDIALGRHDAALPSLIEAYEIFSAVGYHYRAALVASALAEATGEERWRIASAAHASHYPNCPLATMADDAVKHEEALPPQLSPLQRQLARALVGGSDAAELSRRFSRSIYTIERQITEIFEAFGVTSRGELLQEARARGIA